MSRPLAIACALSAADLAERAAELEALGRDALLDSREKPGRAVLRFRPDPVIQERVEAVVAAERECCAFLDFRLEHGDQASVLTIAAPDGGAEMVHELAQAFGRAAPSYSR
jgi:hypothetical protein